LKEETIPQRQKAALTFGIYGTAEKPCAFKTTIFSTPSSVPLILSSYFEG
jgi:hypothetical protein